ncbi:MAG: hypothetical protein QXN93_03100 [Methanomassiliicoccales archaeon]
MMKLTRILGNNMNLSEIIIFGKHAKKIVMTGWERQFSYFDISLLKFANSRDAFIKDVNGGGRSLGLL